MRIRDGLAEGPLGPRLPGRAGRPAGVTGPLQAGPADRVQLTGRGSEIRRARELALGAPDLRASLAGPLGESVARGEYRVAGGEILARLLRDHAFGTGG